MSVYVTGIGAMRQPTVQRAVASIRIWCNLYGSHTVGFTIKQTTFGRQYLHRMTQTLKELKDMFIIKCFFFTISQKSTPDIYICLLSNTQNIYKFHTIPFLTRAPRPLASQSGLPPYKHCSPQIKLSTVLANQVILPNT